MKTRCVEGCSSGSSLQSHDEGGFGHDGVYAMTQFNRHSGYGTRTPGSQSIEMSGSGSGVGGSISSRSGGGGGGGGTRGSTANMAGKPSTAGLANLAGLLSSSQSPITTTNSPQASVDSNNPNDNSPIQHRVLVGFSPRVFYACVFCIIEKIPLLYTEERNCPETFFIG